MRTAFYRFIAYRKDKLALWSLLVCVFILLSLLIGWTTSLYKQQLMNEAYEDASLQLASKSNELRLGVERRLLLSESLAAFVTSEVRDSGVVNSQRFNEFAAHFVPALPDVRNLSLYPGGVAGFIYPYKGNEGVLGNDLFKDKRSEVRENALRTKEQRKITMLGPVNLLQGGSGIVTRQSVYIDGKFWGFVSVVIDLPDLLSGISKEFESDLFDVALRLNGHVLLGDEKLFQQQELNEIVNVPDGNWELAGAIKPEKHRAISLKLLLVRLISLICMGLVLFLLYIQLTGRTKLEEKVSRRTRELQEANEEIEASNEELLAIEEELREQNRMLERKERELRFLAYHDPLTGLYNRSCFNLHLKNSITSAAQSESRIALLYLDLDQFKLVNDTFGHGWGDELLRESARRLTGRLNAEQGPVPEDEPAYFRIGGDEFTVIVPWVTDREDAEQLAAAVVERFRMPFFIRGTEYYMTTSIGIALYPDHGEDATALALHADSAMYKAKEEGKNHYKWFDGKETPEAAELLELRSGLRKALERGEFELYYQPQIEAATGELSGLEALLRWKHPKLGPVSPQQFIPLAEESGLIVEIGEWVLRTACAQNKAWQDAGCPKLRIAVNLSARQFAAPDLVGTVRSVLEQTGLDPCYLELEITENMAMKNENLGTLEQLRDMGILLSIDDFGTQHSSLSYLKSLPVSRIKIDRSFVSGIGMDERDEAIIHAMLLIARRLCLSVVAEGVETESQLGFLKEHDCDEIQGYLFFKPQPAYQTEQVLHNSMQSGSNLAMNGA
ncbi:EAL domain-containing protein [Paenibacillus pasadenensis]|uniref:bifunctional diguanylate cyclase/phosphodiesterase n=1 Tax=Paenibacillus pasadenensis TaxID=217090 RepID=UPI00203FA43A|nr:EAL domain-containing protein [Paenibacillus pasadenensis]MCM3748235.1 EAL domain-containing protein [Paenibacillus pasadenensis]